MFVARRSSPTSSIVHVLLNSVQASQSSCANGSSQQRDGIFFNELAVKICKRGLGESFRGFPFEAQVIFVVIEEFAGGRVEAELKFAGVAGEGNGGGKEVEGFMGEGDGGREAPFVPNPNG